MPVQLNQPTIGALQDNLAKNLVLDARLPQMAQNVVAPQVLATAQKMPDQPAAPAAASQNAMKPFNPAERVDTSLAQRLPEMQGHPEVETSTVGTGQSYVRLRVRATGNDLKVIGASEVDGPLVTPGTIVGQHAYEVTLDSKTIAAEGIPDLGEQRSFPRPGTNEHFITPRQSFEFNVRIPKSAVPDQALPRIGVTLYRFPDASPRVLQGRIAATPGLQARPVAQLPALRLDSLEPAVNEQLLRAFPKLNITPR